MDNLLERNIGIEKYFSYIVIKTSFIKNYYPLAALFDQDGGQTICNSRYRHRLSSGRSGSSRSPLNS